MNKLDYGSGSNPKKGFKSSDFCGSPGYDYYIKDYRVLEAKEHSFDVIHCRNVIHHIHENDLSRLFDEFNRLLHPNGMLIISEPREEFHEQNRLLDIIWYRCVNVNYNIMIPNEYVDYKKYLDQFTFVSSYHHRNNEVVMFQKAVMKNKIIELESVC